MRWKKNSVLSVFRQCSGYCLFFGVFVFCRPQSSRFGNFPLLRLDKCTASIFGWWQHLFTNPYAKYTYKYIHSSYKWNTFIMDMNFVFPFAQVRPINTLFFFVVVIVLRRIHWTKVQFMNEIDHRSNYLLKYWPYQFKKKEKRLKVYG